MRIHLIGVAARRWRTLAALLKQRGHDVSGSDEHVYPPMSDFLRGEGITLLEGYRAEHVAARWTWWSSATPSRAATRSSRPCSIRGIRYASLPETIRDQLLWDAHSIVIAGTHGKTTTTSLTGWLLTHGGADPTVLIGGIARNFGTDGASYRVGQGQGVRHRRRRVRQRLLRQDREVPQVPARHRGGQQHRVRSRRHLRGSRRGAAGVPPARESRAALRADAARRRQPGCGGAGRRREAACRRSGCPRRRSGGARHHVRVAGSRGGSRRHTGQHVSRDPRRRGSRRVHDAAARRSQRAQCARGDRDRRGAGRARGTAARGTGGVSRASSAGSKWSASARGVAVLRRLRPSSDRGRRNASRRPAHRRQTSGSGRSSNRDRRHRAGACSRTISRGRSPAQTRW